MNALLSIQPRYAAMILDGTKQWEFRKSIFSSGNSIDKVYIYATAPIKQVIGEFKVDVIINDTPTNLWQRTHKENGLSEEEFYDYFKGTDRGYAIGIKDVVKYDTPITLPFHAPQNFRYCKVLDKPQ